MFRSQSDFLLFYYEAMLSRLCVPQLLVDNTLINNGDMLIPEFLSQEKNIIFNISPSAVRNFSINEQEKQVSFDTSFGRVPYSIVIPFKNIKGIFSRGSNELFFMPNDFSSTKNESVKKDKKVSTNLKLVSYNPDIIPEKSKANLKVVK